jgi:hypothetical protein
MHFYNCDLFCLEEIIGKKVKSFPNKRKLAILTCMSNIFTLFRMERLMPKRNHKYKNILFLSKKKHGMWKGILA